MHVHGLSCFVFSAFMLLKYYMLLLCYPILPNFPFSPFFSCAVYFYPSLFLFLLFALCHFLFLRIIILKILVIKIAPYYSIFLAKIAVAHPIVLTGYYRFPSLFYFLCSLSLSTNPCSSFGVVEDLSVYFFGRILD